MSFFNEEKNSNFLKLSEDLEFLFRGLAFVNLDQDKERASIVRQGLSPSGLERKNIQ